ncbi:MAG: hypothetical protein J3K34DRAFT_426205 [Monoraphidium minutum]|nr:MAG: hypothetical protein J3K34DRAFT_426205 [Monoraphidium minutum]
MCPGALRRAVRAGPVARAGAGPPNAPQNCTLPAQPLARTAARAVLAPWAQAHARLDASRGWRGPATVSFRRPLPSPCGGRRAKAGACRTRVFVPPLPCVSPPPPVCRPMLYGAPRAALRSPQKGLPVPGTVQRCRLCPAASHITRDCAHARPSLGVPCVDSAPFAAHPVAVQLNPLWPSARRCWH